MWKLLITLPLICLAKLRLPLDLNDIKPIEASCEHNCTNNGLCIEDGVCECNPGWLDFDCSVPVILFDDLSPLTMVFNTTDWTYLAFPTRQLKHTDILLKVELTTGRLIVIERASSDGNSNDVPSYTSFTRIHQIDESMRQYKIHINTEKFQKAEYWYFAVNDPKGSNVVTTWHIDDAYEPTDEAWSFIFFVMIFCLIGLCMVVTFLRKYVQYRRRHLQEMQQVGFENVEGYYSLCHVNQVQDNSSICVEIQQDQLQSLFQKNQIKNW